MTPSAIDISTIMNPFVSNLKINKSDDHRDHDDGVGVKNTTHNHVIRSVLSRPHSIE